MKMTTEIMKMTEEIRFSFVFVVVCYRNTIKFFTVVINGKVANASGACNRIFYNFFFFSLYVCSPIMLKLFFFCYPMFTICKLVVLIRYRNLVSEMYYNESFSKTIYGNSYLYQ